MNVRLLAALSIFVLGGLAVLSYTLYQSMTAQNDLTRRAQAQQTLLAEAMQKLDTLRTAPASPAVGQATAASMAPAGLAPNPSLTDDSTDAASPQPVLSDKQAVALAMMHAVPYDRAVGLDFFRFQLLPFDANVVSFDMTIVGPSVRQPPLFLTFDEKILPLDEKSLSELISHDGLFGIVTPTTASTTTTTIPPGGGGGGGGGVITTNEEILPVSPATP